MESDLDRPSSSPFRDHTKSETFCGGAFMSWESNDSISADLIYQSHEISRRNVLGHMLLAGPIMPLAGILGKEAVPQSSATHSDAVVFKIVTYEVAPEWFKRFLDLSTTN